MNPNYLKYLASINSGFQHPRGMVGTVQVFEHIPKGIKSILEIGCGVGHTLAFVPPNIKYIGIDKSKSMIEQANRNKQDFGWNNASFQLIESTDQLQNFKDIDCVFSESVFSLFDESTFDGYLNNVSKILPTQGKIILLEAIWRDNTSASRIKFINSFTQFFYGVRQGSTFLDSKSDWIKKFEGQGYSCEVFPLNEESEISKPIYVERANQYKLAHKIEKRKKLQSPLRFMQYVYFRTLDLLISKWGNNLTSCIFVLENRSSKK